ncbi:carboxypeptidase regulatory-like domain-containing protein [Hymenobacter glacialis]|uniref:carboxypeptidase regulatory-like domain-containing protein n=1 Tax=Hymenobacter glacialis TaxID=1908236 RepID=UPI000F76948A|nr:carboxypeptidase regulatory-like domain-containing protein [Hymenobacter glacialis]
MNKRLSTNSLSITIGAVLLCSSCSKKAQDAPAPTVETPVGPSITGLVQPADALMSVSLTDDKSHQDIASATLDSKGAYSFNTVPAGTYSLYYVQKRGYVRPRQQSVTVTAGKTTVVPTVTAVRSTASFTANGIAFSPTLVDLMIGPDKFSIVLTDETTYGLSLTMPYSVRVGTYPLNTASTYAVFNELGLGAFDSRLTPSTAPAGGTLTITAVENTAPFPSSVSGTFSFTGTNATSGAQKIISGTFANAYF